MEEKLIFSSKYVLCQKMEKVVEEGAVVVGKDGKIVDVGERSHILSRYKAKRYVERKHGILLPGFINTHTHAAMVYLRGLADDLPLHVWLSEHIWPTENMWLCEEFVRDATKLAVLEMIRSGTTLFNDMYFFLEESAAVIEDVGMKAILGMGVFDFPSRAGSGPDDYLKRAERICESYRGSKRVSFAICPHAVYTCSPQNMKRALMLSQRYNLLIHTHACETEWEIEEVKKRYGTSPIKHLDKIGIFSQKTILAHVVHPSDEEIEILAKKSVSISHCLESNLKLGSGIAPLSKFIDRGVLVSIGTDGAASNNDLDMLGEIQTVSKVHKGILKDPTFLKAKDVLKFATIYGAMAVGREDCGSIEPGFCADMICVEFKKPHLFPLYDPFSALVYSAKSSDISDVLVDGDFLMEKGRVLGIDEDEVFDKARFWKGRIEGVGR